jgi:hypothetical protein
MDNPHVTLFLPPEGAQASKGHRGAPSWPSAARREA